MLQSLLRSAEHSPGRKKFTSEENEMRDGEKVSNVLQSGSL